MHDLTQHELRIARMAAEGYQNKEIAHDLKLSLHSVKDAMKVILEKTGSRHRLDLAILDVAGKL